MGAKYASTISTTQAEAGFDGTLMGSHLRDWDDIKGLPFFPTGTGSLLSRCLTPDVWNLCKDRRDRFGFSFK